MRVVAWSAAALALLTLAGALRTSQVEGTSRSARRLPPSDTSMDTEQVQHEHTFRPRQSRRRNDSQLSQETVKAEAPSPRSRTRQRPQETPPEKTPTVPSRVESKRFFSRTRNNPVKTTENVLTVSSTENIRSRTKEPVSRSDNTRSRVKPNNRRVISTTATPATTEVTPARTIENITEVNPKLDETNNVTSIEATTKVTTKVTDAVVSTTKEDIEPAQFRRRAPVPTASTKANDTVITRRQGRAYTGSNISPLDLSVSGTMNSLSIKEPTTVRTANEIRNSRKLRFKQRWSDTDSNLTGEGILRRKVTQSSQNKELNPSQIESQTMAPIIVDTMPSNPEVPRKPTKSMKVIRRPLNRGKAKSSVTLPKKKKTSDEISEDDNYPASFKALLQAKNSSTQPSSPPSESLSVKESQNVYSTFTSPAQTLPTGPAKTLPTGLAKNKYSTLRTSLRPESDTVSAAKEDTKPVDSANTTSANETQTSQSSSVATTAASKFKPRSSEYRPRGTYNSRQRKSSASPASSESTQSRSTERPQYKFSRKFKLSSQTPRSSSTESSVQNDNKGDTEKFAKKSLVRPSYLSRRKTFTPKSSETSSSERPEKPNDIKGESVNVLKPVLPRTSFYSKFRKNKETSTTSTTESIETSSAAEIVQTPADKKDENSVDSPLIFSLLKAPSEEPINGIKQTEKPFFIIAVSSMESSENSVMSEETTKALEHTTARDSDIRSTKFNMIQEKPSERVTPAPIEEATVIVTPSTRNISTRRYGRKRTKYTKETQEENLEMTPKPRERKKTRKFNDNDSKSPEPSTNGIPEQEKLKSRYSSKYRGSLPDKHYYRPTVPTITPSTVEGEEFKIGDMNAISITKSRSTLSSADLILSESLMKPQHTMNVEASEHSSSVTISIFDALADILTSTPRVPRLSTTTEITTTQQTIVTKQTDPLNGVSSNVNVNTVYVQSTESTAVTDVDGNTKSVQNVPLIDNNLSAKASSRSLNTDDDATVNTLPYTFLPTTPVSARKPFAFKFLYSETTPSDKISTVTSSMNQPSTDSPKMVYTKVSDLLTNNVVSSELTSMLSNNIREIIDSMDPETRSQISEVDMARILNNLIPKAVVGPLNENRFSDDTPDTTPYSLEVIRDTENIDINNGVVSLQNVSVENIVNNTSTTEATTIGSITSLIRDVNSTVTESKTTLSESANQTTLVESTTPSLSVDSSKTTVVVTTTASSLVTPTSFASTDLDAAPVNNDTVSMTNNTNIDNTTIPLPFFTNSKIVDFVPSDIEEVDNIQTRRVPITLTSQSLTPLLNTEITSDEDKQDPSMVSPLQFWVLSKKARVLKMIEDLIRQHNTEIATTPPLTELLDQPNNIPLSNRLTEILNTMTSTESSVNIPTSPMTTLSPPPFPLLIQPVKLNVNTDPLSGSTTLTTTEGKFTTSGTKSTTTPDDSDLSFRNVAETTSGTQPSSTTTRSPSSSVLNTGFPSTQSFTTEGFKSTKQSEDDGNTETTTASVNTETTQINIDTTTDDIEETTMLSDNESTTKSSVKNVTLAEVLPVGPSQPPKKDYVIFGILPNNTVVRKDPNEDILESLTEASPYIIYSVLPNNTVIRRFPNGTRVPRVMQKIDVLPISPWSLRNPYSPIHNNPAIVRPRSNPIRVSTNTETSPTSNNEENLTNDTVNNQQPMIPSSALNISGSSSLGVTTATYRPPAEKSTASHVLSLRTTTMLPSIDEILLNSISSATREEMIISMMSSTHEPRILTLDIDPETKQIRTERPGDGNESPVFRFIPIDQVMVTPEDTNVQKLATKMPNTSDTAGTTDTEINTQTPQIDNRFQNTDPTTTVQVTVGIPNDIEQSTPFVTTNAATMTSVITTTEPLTTTQVTMTSTTQAATTTTTTPIPTTTQASTTTTEASTTTQVPTTLTMPITSTTQQSTVTSFVTATSVDEDFRFLQNLLKPTERNPKIFGGFNSANQIPLETTTLRTEKTRVASGYQSSSFSSSTQSQESNILQAILSANTRGTSTMSTPNNNLIGTQSTTSRSIEDDIKQFEEDTKLLKALLAATGQNPNALNIPSLDGLNTPTTQQTTTQRPTTSRIQTTTNSDTQYIEDAKLLQALLEATPRNTDNRNAPVISGITSNVRFSSNSQSNSNARQPIYTSRTVTPEATTTEPPRTVSSSQPSTMTDRTTTMQPRRQTTPQRVPMVTARRAPARFTATTEVPSTSTFSDQEDLLFLQNLKSVLNTNANHEDPESALANRVIALAVERSLNEIQSGKDSKDGRTGISTVPTTPIYRTTTTTQRPTTTTQQTTTQRITTIANDNTPSLEDDLKQFQEDTKLLQALLKATGQDPSKINIPTLPAHIANIKVSGTLPPRAEADLNLLSNLLAAPSPLNEPFDSLTTKANEPSTVRTNTTPKPYGAKIAVKDVLKNEEDDAKLLNTLVKLQGVQETTTQKGKLTITGQSTDEALKKLIAQTKPPRMMADATKSPATISTEYGKSNDALLAALLKEQGFGPTTASSLDEQLRLAALLNQVVVTPKTRKTTPPPPPSPEPSRRPVLDGLAWLWQQWRETAPGPVSRPNRRPAASPGPSISSSTSNRVNWFGSGPFVGNAEETTGNRVPLEPPREANPGQGQLISAAINVTRAFTQFLGAAIQGAAKTVQSVIKAGQKATAEVYTNGGSG